MGRPLQPVLSKEITQTKNHPCHLCHSWLKSSYAQPARHEIDVLTESETKLEKPKLFKVLLHNDDFTTMDFVVWVLQYVFNRNDPDAISIMLKVHNEGLGIAGIYPYEVASMKSEKAMNLAKAREYPLLCTVEEE